MIGIRLRGGGRGITLTSPPAVSKPFGCHRRDCESDPLHCLDSMVKSAAQSLLARSRLARAVRMNTQMLGPMLMGRERRVARAWSQHGEDEFLVRELSASFECGYYVDVGANHPAKLSNTYRLYNMGMRGVCVEPNDELCVLHQRYRPGDMVICAAVGETNGLAKFYELSYHGISTVSESEFKTRQAAGAKLMKVSIKPMLTLATILQQCVPESRTKLELLSVDAEGFDEIVLRSNDWARFRPRLVLVEANSAETSSTIKVLMGSLNYEAAGAFGVNTLFRDSR